MKSAVVSVNRPQESKRATYLQWTRYRSELCSSRKNRTRPSGSTSRGRNGFSSGAFFRRYAARHYLTLLSRTLAHAALCSPASASRCAASSSGSAALATILVLVGAVVGLVFGVIQFLKVRSIELPSTTEETAPIIEEANRVRSNSHPGNVDVYANPGTTLSVCEFHRVVPP